MTVRTHGSPHRGHTGRRLLGLAARLSLAALLGLTACSGDSGGSDGPVSLRMAVWSANEDHLALFEEIADAYVADHDEVDSITFDPLPFETYTTTLTTQIAGGNAPDLAWIFENAAPDFVTSGALASLDGVLDDQAELLPSTTQLWQHEGELFAYPFSTSPFGVFVNTDLFAEAGQPTPAELIEAGDWTWDSAVAAAAAISDQTGRAGLVVRDFDYQLWDNLATVWTGWGARAWSEDGTECGFAEQPMVDAMTFLHQAIFDRSALPGPGSAADFFAGESAMTIAQISRAALLAEDGFGWDLVPLPAGPAGEYGVIGQAGIGVLTSADHEQAAAEFLAFFTNAENSAKLARFFPPPRESLLTADTLAAANPLLSAEQLDAVVLTGIETGTVKPSHTGQAELAQRVRAALDPLWEPDADVAAVLAGVCTSIEPLLAG